MTTENLEGNDLTGNQALQPVQPAAKTFSEAEVQAMIKDRVNREKEAARLKDEENTRLRKQLEEIKAKAESGTASTHELGQLEAARQTVHQKQQQGYTPEQVNSIVQHQVRVKDLESKLEDAHKKDPEFAKLLQNGNKLYEEEVHFASYLPNGPAVIKKLMSDKKALEVYRKAQENFHRDNGVAAMMVLNNLSEQLENKKESPQPNQYEPPADLSDSSDDEQDFDISNHINDRY